MGTPNHKNPKGKEEKNTKSSKQLFSLPPFFSLNKYISLLLSGCFVLSA